MDIIRERLLGKGLRPFFLSDLQTDSASGTQAVIPVLETNAN